MKTEVHTTAASLRHVGAAMLVKAAGLVSFCFLPIKCLDPPSSAMERVLSSPSNDDDDQTDDDDDDDVSFSRRPFPTVNLFGHAFGRTRKSTRPKWTSPSARCIMRRCEAAKPLNKWIRVMYYRRAPPSTSFLLALALEYTHTRARTSPVLVEQPCSS